MLCCGSAKMIWHCFWVINIAWPFLDIMNNVDLTILICNGKSLCDSSKICFFPFSRQFPWKHFCSTIISSFFQILMVSLYLSRHDQYFKMFKYSDVFEFTNFPFKTKYNNTAVYSVNSNYLFSKRKQEKKMLKELFD